ncbi:hypothetical protein MKX01_030673 [Papaver californicum]|nr:hypothetical protein MKX01_030673 [Papaver californicum]
MSSRNPTYNNPIPCKHLTDYKQNHGLQSYSCVQKNLKTTPNGKTTINKDQTKIPRCSICFKNQGIRLYYCLICSSISCCQSPDTNHALLHSQNERNGGHEILIDIEKAELFCCICCDQVYDPDFDKLVMSKQIMEMPTNNNGVDFRNNNDDNCSSKRRKIMVSSTTSTVGSPDYKNGSKELMLMMRRNSNSCFPWGLRGLNNLGNTCFMNSVLQALIHTPPLRNYFLSDRHNRESCRKTSADRLCLCCDIDAIFTSVFSGDRAPYSPARFLFSWWQHSANLASYEQQDAHEFFISMLDRIHEREGQVTAQNKENEDCHCIGHKVFSGILRSDVTCTTCGFTSTTYDPCVDISLDLNTSSVSPKDVTEKPTKSNQNAGISTLVGCLDLFTRPEKLGSDQKLFCQHCQTKENSLKQMSIRKLPLVLCFHIKRFEHSPVRKMSRKIDRYLQFPFSLDMIPYLSSSIVRNRFGNRIFAFEGDESDMSTEFEVFAVVSHSGKLESGHYVTYLRLRSQWYKCDDAWVTQVSERLVRASQVYLIYYVQKMLYIKSGEDFLVGDPAFLQTPACC